LNARADSVTSKDPLTLVPERRERRDRRRTTWRTFVRGAVSTRRRGGRRSGEHALFVDWHEPQLLFLALTILLLNIADAFLTLTLLTMGAEEVNPLLAYVLRVFPEWFAIAKMGMTATGVIVLVVMARAKLFRLIRVRLIMHGFLAAYVVLIAYEWWMLRSAL
jgi:hypothetical protein